MPAPIFAYINAYLKLLRSNHSSGLKLASKFVHANFIHGPSCVRAEFAFVHMNVLFFPSVSIQPQAAAENMDLDFKNFNDRTLKVLVPFPGAGKLACISLIFILCFRELASVRF